MSTPELGQAFFGNKWEEHDAPEFIGDGLYMLSELLGTRDPGSQHHGVLGGEWGYGQDFKNDVFEMFPYWWGDCECGFETRESEWADVHPHTAACYQAELERRGAHDYDGLSYEVRHEIAPQLAKEWGLPEYGCAVHCTCSHTADYAAWTAANDHDERCPVVRPNFAHFPSGLRVHWYKYIGRGMTTNRPVELREWLRIFDECRASLILDRDTP